MYVTNFQPNQVNQQLDRSFNHVKELQPSIISYTSSSFLHDSDATYSSKEQHRGEA